MLRSIATVAALIFVTHATAQVPAVRDNVGAMVGFYSGPSNGPQGRLLVTSSTGYVGTVVAATGRLDVNSAESPAGGYILSPVFFQSVDCTGPGYVITSASASGLVSGQLPMSGAVFISNSDFILHDVWYVPKSALSFVAGAQATLFVRILVNGSCVPGSGVQPDSVLYPAFPNEPNVTGFPSAPFVPPLRVDVVPVSAVFSIFRDSFESTQAAMPRLQAAYVA